jgi:putative membrane protein
MACVERARRRRRRPPLEDVGVRPDYRFSFANERTFLAWIRTALALVGGGLAVSELLPDVELPGGGRVLGLPLIALGALIALTSLRRWEQSERAMRLGDPITSSWLQRAVALGVGLAAVLAAAAVAVGTDTG